MSDKGITLEGLAAAVDVLREELATWKALARKQDTLTAAQITATQSGATAAKIDQIAVNTAAIQALSAQVAGQISLEYVTTLPATGEPFTLYLVPQGDGTAPNYCNEYLWVNGDWELIGTTGSMANNGELTIQVNGVAVGTFTANQAANSAINITVPTNTNQLVNGAQYVDAASLATALALKQNNLNAAQLDAVNSGITAALVTQIGTNQTAIAGKQDALTTAQQAAVDSGATAAKIDQIASNAAAIVSLTSSKQDTLSTAQLAAVNSGITSAAVQQISTNTTDIATKAADNAVVHLAGAETIPGDKTFTGAVVTHDVTPETTGTYSLGSSSYQWSAVYAQTYYYNGTRWGLDRSNIWTGDNAFSKNILIRNNSTPKLLLRDERNNRAYNNISAGGVTRLETTDVNSKPLSRVSSIFRSDGASVLEFFVFTEDSSGNEISRGLSLTMGTDGSSSFRPNASDTNLGSSSVKWKTLNGINPGALSFPANSWVDIDTTGWSAGGANRVRINNADPTYPGWLFVRLSNIDPTTDYCNIRLFGNNVSDMTVDGAHTGTNIRMIVPVPASTSVIVYCSVIPSYCRYYACLGNV